MRKRKSTEGPQWPEIIAYAEDKLKRTKLRAGQLEALISVFRAHSEAGDPCPTELVKSIQSDRCLNSVLALGIKFKLSCSHDQEHVAPPRGPSQGFNR
jgi:hypothetical protein